ncbi:hypothetical protein A3Q56_06370 [Intoshia linei]|uniref:Bromo domain-containing protein n=1 Tax=Intoshia linei TaxID=1819745 RepID=A0A177AVB9_9BILA|nr:hypothetical protein A3Q56_06370 [Intoshia linei]
MFEMKRSDYIVSRQKWFQVIVEELEKFDTKGIFLHEITDNIAPLYSTIIKNPLCIDKIKNKLIYYQNLTDFRQDFNLIIENCQHYNDQETIFYQDSLMFQKEIENIFHQDGLDGLMTKYPSLDNYREIFPEFNQSIDNIKNVNEQAAERAASKIKKAKLDSVFLRRNNDGSTSLNLINPETSNQTPIVFQSDNFGEVLKKLKKTSQLISFRENGLYLLKPVKTLDYDPFSEYAPKYDSTFSKCKLNEFNDVLSHSASLNTCVGSKNDYSSSLLSSWVDYVSDKKTTKSSNSISTSEAESSI